MVKSEHARPVEHVFQLPIAGRLISIDWNLRSRGFRGLFLHALNLRLFYLKKVEALLAFDQNIFALSSFNAQRLANFSLLSLKILAGSWL